MERFFDGASDDGNGDSAGEDTSDEESADMGDVNPMMLMQLIAMVQQAPPEQRAALLAQTGINEQQLQMLAPMMQQLGMLMGAPGRASTSGSGFSGAGQRLVEPRVQ